jgi:hypothetical protein
MSSSACLTSFDWFALALAWPTLNCLHFYYCLNCVCISTTVLPLPRTSDLFDLTRCLLSNVSYDRGQSASPSWYQATKGDLRPSSTEIIFRQLRVSYYGAPSLTIRRVYNLLAQLLLGFASAVTLGSKSRRIRDHVLLSLSHLRLGSFFCRLLRLTGLRWKYSSPPSNTSFSYLGSFRCTAKITPASASASASASPVSVACTLQRICAWTSRLPTKFRSNLSCWYGISLGRSKHSKNKILV